jgi:hypothetical protein
MIKFLVLKTITTRIVTYNKGLKPLTEGDVYNKGLDRGSGLNSHIQSK